MSGSRLRKSFVREFLDLFNGEMGRPLLAGRVGGQSVGGWARLMAD
jgi:hypothetical protein